MWYSHHLISSEIINQPKVVKLPQMPQYVVDVIMDVAIVM